MRYQEIHPGEGLRHYVKCYYIYESDSDLGFDDKVLPSGNMEIIFNLGSGNWQTGSSEDGLITTPSVELWGQIIRPLAVRSIGRNTMLGIRFYPHAAAYFLPEKMDVLNNLVVDAREVVGDGLGELYGRLQDIESWPERIRMIETFLEKLLMRRHGSMERAGVVGDVMQEMRRGDFFDNIENVAARYGITSRYLQKLFLQYTGLTPKLYSKINRFQQSLKLVGRREASLTSIAYDCGYFDQSHFIREFKSFTGHTPSAWQGALSPVTAATAGI